MDISPPIYDTEITSSIKRQARVRQPCDIDWENVDCAAAIALHFHQPEILESGVDLKSASVVSNVADMQKNGHWDATKFLECYERLGKDMISRMTGQGLRPSIMVEYTGTLLWGLRRMGRQDIIDSVKVLLHSPHVEVLGCPWGHAVAPSTPVNDYKLHLDAWWVHMAAEFGVDVLARIRGFSPSEMAIPNDPDVAYAFVKNLKDAGYDWVLVQEHTIEHLDGHGIRDPRVPHQLVCKNSQGQVASILCVIKTQGSDTKLVGQMQPWYEAQGQKRATIKTAQGSITIPRIVTQISDGENGGVIMNEFPGKFESVVGEARNLGNPVLCTVSQYLDHLDSLGCSLSDFEVVQPKGQAKIWKIVKDVTPDSVKTAIATLKQQDHSFHMDGGSWTNDISWVKGYADVLDPMEKYSARFHQITDGKDVERSSKLYTDALYYLLVSQTSCYRYWGSGTFTDYAKELIRRGNLVLDELELALST